MNSAGRATLGMCTRWQRGPAVVRNSLRVPNCLIIPRSLCKCVCSTEGRPAVPPKGHRRCWRAGPTTVGSLQQRAAQTPCSRAIRA
jgi:hypothetical protein